MPVLQSPQGQRGSRPVLLPDGPFRPPQQPRRGWFIFGALLVATLVIVSHGCHAGDHDDEPAWFRQLRPRKKTLDSSRKVSFLCRSAGFAGWPLFATDAQTETTAGTAIEIAQEQHPAIASRAAGEG